MEYNERDQAWFDGSESKPPPRPRRKKEDNVFERKCLKGLYIGMGVVGCVELLFLILGMSIQNWASEDSADLQHRAGLFQFQMGLPEGVSPTNPAPEHRCRHILRARAGAEASPCEWDEGSRTCCCSMLDRWEADRWFSHDLGLCLVSRSSFDTAADTWQLYSSSFKRNQVGGRTGCIIALCLVVLSILATLPPILTRYRPPVRMPKVKLGVALCVSAILRFIAYCIGLIMGVTYARLWVLSDFCGSLQLAEKGGLSRVGPGGLRVGQGSGEKSFEMFGPGAVLVLMALILTLPALVLSVLAAITSYRLKESSKPTYLPIEPRLAP